MDVRPPLRVLTNYRKEQVPPLSQGKLADKLGVVRETVARWESGHRKPDASLLPRITDVTGIPAKALRPDLAMLLKRA
jgi:transcriptional regulator with XRE-family HTH domain